MTDLKYMSKSYVVEKLTEIATLCSATAEEIEKTALPLEEVLGVLEDSAAIILMMGKILRDNQQGGRAVGW